MAKAPTGAKQIDEMIAQMQALPDEAPDGQDMQMAKIGAVSALSKAKAAYTGAIKLSK